MHTKTGVLALFSTAASAGLLVAACLTTSIRAADPTAVPAPLSPELQAAKDLFSDRCSASHSLPDPVAKAYNRDEWQRTVDRMNNKYKAGIAPDDSAKIVDYLATFAPATTNAAPIDPWSASSDDVWRTIPTASHVYTFSGAYALAGLNPVSSGDAGPTPRWTTSTSTDGSFGVTASIPSASPGQFALLVNKAPTDKNIDLRTRFEIVNGHKSPAVGLVFGYVDPAHYYVVRYSEQTDTVSLIRIDGADHSTLQQTPRLLPSPVPVTGVYSAPTANIGSAPPVASASLDGWHILHVQVNNNTIQAWIDRAKRINTTDPNYVGGKVALWSQGDTDALFNTWEIDQYENEPGPTS